MSNGTILDKLMNEGTLSQVLQQSQTPSEDVKAFKQILFKLGFDGVKNSITQEIDGIYDAATSAVVKSFSEKNNINGNGQSVTEQLAQMIIKRYNSLPAMLELHHNLKNNQLDKVYFQGSKDKAAIAGLHLLLHDLGVGDGLGKTIDDAKYGKATIKAIKAFLNKKKEKGGLIKKIADFGKDHGLVHTCCGNILKHFAESKGLGNLLNLGKKPHPVIKELQNSLHLLGFGKDLGQDIKNLDGVFGHPVQKALKSFAQKNNISTDGNTITSDIASTIKNQVDNLPFVHQLERDFREGKTEKKYFEGSKSKLAVAALQAVLKKLGYGKELNWAEKLNDGNFDSSVTNALKAYFKKGFFQKANSVTPDMMKTIINDASKNLGPNWKDHIKSLNGDENSILTHYTNSNYKGGSPIIANVGFTASLDKINNYAAKNNVQIYITNSFRRYNNVPGAIVTPAKWSNHKVGHAIDMNIVYRDENNHKSIANSSMMHPDNRNNWPAPVKGFLEDIINDPTLKWGGTFNHPDPVHIDDRFNNDRTKWEEQRKLAIAAYDNHDIRPIE